MKADDPDPLDDLLAQWQVQAEAPPDFRREVWRRIASETRARLGRALCMVAAAPEARGRHPRHRRRHGGRLGLTHPPEELNPHDAYVMSVSPFDPNHLKAVDHDTCGTTHRLCLPHDWRLPERPCGSRVRACVRANPQEVGLRWLKDEYHLDDATFRARQHPASDYFMQCTKMCRQLDDADRPLLWRARQRNRQPGDLDDQLSKEQSLCGDCEKAATDHLRQVAAFMPPEQGKRFLDDILPILQQQRREHDRRVSSSIRR
jgi:hypothetical protein